MIATTLVCSTKLEESHVCSIQALLLLLHLVFSCFDISKMRGFTFQLYFNRTSICHNIIECCVRMRQQYDTFKVIWLGDYTHKGKPNRETKPKTIYKSKDVVKIGDFSRLRPFSLHFYFFILLLLCIPWHHVKRTDGTHIRHSKNLPSCFRDVGFHIILKTERFRSIPRFLASVFHSIRSI